MWQPYWLNPGPQVWGALIEASVLNEVFPASICHCPTVVPVEVVQVGVVGVGLLRGVGCATGIVFPRRALRIIANSRRE